MGYMGLFKSDFITEMVLAVAAKNLAYEKVGIKTVSDLMELGDGFVLLGVNPHKWASVGFQEVCVYAGIEPSMFNDCFWIMKAKGFKNLILGTESFSMLESRLFLEQNKAVFQSIQIATKLASKHALSHQFARLMDDNPELVALQAIINRTSDERGSSVYRLFKARLGPNENPRLAESIEVNLLDYWGPHNELASDIELELDREDFVRLSEMASLNSEDIGSLIWKNYDQILQRRKEFDHERSIGLIDTQS